VIILLILLNVMTDFASASLSEPIILPAEQ